MALLARFNGVAGLALITLLMAACGHAQPAHDSAAPPAAVSPTPPVTTPAPSEVPSAAPTVHHHHRPYSDQNPRPRRAGDFVVKQLLVSRDPDAGGHSLHPDRPGVDFWAEEVRTCVKRSSERSHPVGWGDWRAQGTDGRSYPADPAGAHPLPTPTYPFHQVLAPGGCVTGWWLIPVPKLPGGPTAIQFAPGGGSTLIEWMTLR